MTILNKIYITFGVVSLLLLGLYINSDTEFNNTTQETTYTNNKVENIQQHQEKIKKYQLQTVQKKDYVQKNQIVKKHTKIMDIRNFTNNTAINNNIIQQKQRQELAKARYEREQLFQGHKAQATKRRKEYYKIQKFIHSRNPKMIQNDSTLMKNKQVRSYLAKLNYQKRQHQIEQQMKIKYRTTTK